MPQFNIFGELEQDQGYCPEVIDEQPEPPEMPLPRKSKKRESFEIGKCRACGQLLLDDPDNKIDNELCPMCDDRLKVRYNQFQNFALIRALRAHKTINR